MFAGPPESRPSQIGRAAVSYRRAFALTHLQPVVVRRFELRPNGSGRRRAGIRPHSNRPKRFRAEYRIRNWPQYETGLKRRGDLTLWLDEAAIAGWQAPRRTTPGGQARYSDLAIELGACHVGRFYLSRAPTRPTAGYAFSTA